MEKYYPIYISLFANNSGFSQKIKRATNSNYSHATISLDPSLNEMYSFNRIPLAQGAISSPRGFLRESIYGPMYKTNLYFTVLITFVTEDGYRKIRQKLDQFISNYARLGYSTLGLVQYFFNIGPKTTTKNIDKKKKWFCSEFVAYMMREGSIPGVDKTMQSPQDLYDNSASYVEAVDYTLSTFSEKDLIRRTKIAKQKFIANLNKPANESSIYLDLNMFEFYEISQEGFHFLQERKVEKNMTWYTSMLDWKRLHEAFIKIFGKGLLSHKFDVIEYIVRRYIIKETPSENTTDKIIQLMQKLKSENDIEYIVQIIPKKNKLEYLDSAKHSRLA